MTDSNKDKIIRLEERQSQMVADLIEVKEDLKEIKEFLMGRDPQVITRSEFEGRINSLERKISVAQRMKWVFALAATIIASFFSLMLAHIIQDAQK